MSRRWISSRAVVQSVVPKLESYAQELVESGVLPRLFVSFLRYDGRIQPSVLTTADWSIQIKEDDQGLLGAAINDGETKVWDARVDSENSEVFIRADPRTVFEIAFPIVCSEGVTGVGMVDYFVGEIPFGVEDLVVAASDWQREISSLVSSPDQLENDLNKTLMHYVGDCIKATKSLRGYVAFSHWTGSPLYVAEGQDHDKFLPLSLDVGIVGEAFHKGEVINEGNVWHRPGYIPSDDRISSELVIPIKHDGRTIGVLNLESTTENHYSDSRVKSALAFENQIRAVALDLVVPKLSEEEEKVAVFGGHVQKTLRPSKLSLPTLRRDQLLVSLLDTLTESLTQFTEVASVKMHWVDEEFQAGQKGFSPQVLDQLTRSSRPFEAINGGTKSILFGLKLSEQLVSIVEVVLEDSHGPAIVNSAQLLVYVTVSEIERRFENQRRFAIEPFLERLAALHRIDDVQALLPDFLREYLDCDEVVVLQAHKINEEWVFQVQSASPVSHSKKGFPFSQSTADSKKGDERERVLAHSLETGEIIVSQQPRYSGRARFGEGLGPGAGPSWSIPLQDSRSSLVFSIWINANRSFPVVVRLLRSKDIGSAPFSNSDMDKVSMVKGMLEKMFRAR